MTAPTTTDRSGVYRRIVRRETHSPRSTLAIVLAAVLAVVLAWIATESVLALLGQPALLVAPLDGIAAAAGLPADVATSTIIAGGAVVAVIGVVVLLVALLPGRLARHTLPVSRTAVVVDDRVVASALARTASRTAGIDPDQVVVTVGHRTALVTVRPSSGFAVDRQAIDDAVRRQLGAFDLAPALLSAVVIEKDGVVGA